MMSCPVVVLDGFELPPERIPAPIQSALVIEYGIDRVGDRDKSCIIPADRIRNEATSVATKIFVSHLFLIKECLSPSTARIILPRIM